jgi:RimJ/RimL family protein N-acetyltransferase
MIDFTKTLETNQILLRPLRQEDYNRFTKITDDKNLWIYFTNDLSDKDVLFKWIETGVQEIKDKKRLAFSIIDKRTNSIIGCTSMEIYLSVISDLRLDGHGFAENFRVKA